MKLNYFRSDSSNGFVTYSSSTGGTFVNVFLCGYKQGHTIIVSNPCGGRLWR